MHEHMFDLLLCLICVFLFVFLKTQRQILDAELDIFNRQQEGKDTADLQKHVLELKTKAQSLGLLTGNIPVSRGRGRSFRGR